MRTITPIDEYLWSRLPQDGPQEGLLKDVAFNRKSFDGGEVPGPQDNQLIQVGADGIEVVLYQGIDEPQFRKTLSAAINATRGFDPFSPPEEADWEEMLQGGLQTALETQTIIFAVKGVSRTCTHQLVRSRKAAFHQQSQRAYYYGDHPEFRMPESVWRIPEVRMVWIDAIRRCHDAYRDATDRDVSYQDARFILPEGTTNFILLEYPVREFLNVYAYRACSMFQWEISHTMRECKRVLVEKHPWIEPYVKIGCEKTHGALDATQFKVAHNLSEGVDPGEEVAHTCTFQGWEEVDEQCDFPWARESNRQFRSERHAITKEGK